QEIWFSEPETEQSSGSVPPQTPSNVPIKTQLTGSTHGREAGGPSGTPATPSAPGLKSPPMLFPTPGEAGVVGEVHEPEGVEAIIAVQIMEVVYRGPDHLWLVNLLQGLIFGPGGGDKEKKDRSKKRESSKRRCQALVKSMVDMLVALDDGICPIPLPPPGDDHSQATGAAPASPLDTPAKQLLACVETLSILCKASPELLVEHVDTLLPYLKAQNGIGFKEEASLCQQVADIVHQTLPLMHHADHDQMGELAQDLVHLVYKFGSAVVHSSLRCLARLVVTVTKDTSPLLALLQRF
ncbi:unnamed protein product, partial [Discosporangium mesarthrocarpum]